MAVLDWEYPDLIQNHGSGNLKSQVVTLLCGNRTCSFRQGSKVSTRFLVVVPLEFAVTRCLGLGNFNSFRRGRYPDRAILGIAVVNATVFGKVMFSLRPFSCLFLY